MFSKSFEEFPPPSVVACSQTVYSGFLVKTFKIKKKKSSKKTEDHLVTFYQNFPSKLRVKERLDFLRMTKHSQSANKSGAPILLSNSRYLHANNSRVLQAKIFSSSSVSVIYATVVTMLQNVENRRDLNILNYVTTIITQSRIIQSFQLQNYIFIYEVNVKEVYTQNNFQ